MRREYPAAPLVGVAAAVFNPAGEVLLVKRGRPPGQGRWGIPGGLLNLGEKLADGARREVREECAIEICIGDVIATFEPIERDEDGRVRYHYVVVDFWASLVTGSATPQDDAVEVAWAELANLNDYPMPEQSRQVIRMAYAAWRQRHP